MEMNTDWVESSPACPNQGKGFEEEPQGPLVGEAGVDGGGGSHNASRRTSLRSAALRRKEGLVGKPVLLLNHGQ